MNDITPGRAMRETFRWAPVVTMVAVVIVACGAVVCLVGWQAAGWFEGHQINRQTQQTEQGQGYQSTLHDRFTADLNTINSEAVQITAHPAEKADLQTEQASTASDACSKASQITSADPLTGADATWAARNCSGSALSTSSPYFQAGNQ